LPFVKLKFQPGVDKEGTDYENATGWFDSDMVRFRGGFPESIGGWVAYIATTFVGTCRSLFPWTSLDGENRIGMGTHKKLYVEAGGVYNDLTPIRASSTINTNPFSISAGSAVVTVTDTAHGALIDDYVTFSGATSGDGTLTADVMNAEYPIDSITDDDTYVVTMSATATGTDTTEGGASVVAAYQISVGLDTAVIGTGWGVDTWGSEGWGSASTNATDVTAQLRLWSHTSFGEDLVACIRNGKIYYWDTSGGEAARAVDLAGLSGADNTPTIARIMLTIPESRHLMALACDPFDAIGTQDTLLIRWADAESLVLWTQDTNNSAGSLRINIGSEIITGLVAKQGTLVWTDSALHIVNYIGAPLFFGTGLLSGNTNIMGPNAMVEIDEITYWMGSQNFFVYDGTVRTLPCTLRDHVFSNINTTQALKVFTGVNRGESEVTWFYATTTSEVDRCVTYNFEQDIWYPGTLARTAWIDRGFNPYPIGANTDNKLYNHELGADDGTTNPVTAINSYAESSAFEPFEGEGYQFAFADRIIPDVTFTNKSTAASPAVILSITPKDYPGASTGTTSSTTVTRSASSPEAYTNQASIRVRGRSLIYKIENTAKGVMWREGTPRLQVRRDGRQ
jgi:hypothetical protein